tara:strand:+ start:793 stop:1767 length:975 start_codon:yes stop_codon:yes gene_type:complete
MDYKNITDTKIRNSVSKYQSSVNKSRKYLVSAHGKLIMSNSPASNNTYGRFRVPDNVVLIYLTPIKMTINALKSNRLMQNWYQSRKFQRKLNTNNFTQRSRSNGISEKPRLLERSYIAPPGFLTFNLGLYFPDHSDNNNSKQWEKDEMGIFKLPLKDKISNKEKSGEYKVPRFNRVFNDFKNLSYTTLSDVVNTFSASGGGVLLVDSCRFARGPNGDQLYCRVTGKCRVGNKRNRNNSNRCSEIKYEGELTKRFLTELSVNPVHLTRQSMRSLTSDQPRDTKGRKKRPYNNIRLGANESNSNSNNNNNNNQKRKTNTKATRQKM